jgi:hypothetical protein
VTPERLQAFSSAPERDRLLVSAELRRRAEDRELTLLPALEASASAIIAIFLAVTPNLVARGKTHTLIGVGYFRYAAYGRGTRTLIQTMAVLLLLSIVILIVSTANPVLGAEPYFNWGHGVIDRLFTAAAGAWLFATIASYVDLVGAHSKKSARVVITWKYEADAGVH